MKSRASIPGSLVSRYWAKLMLQGEINISVGSRLCFNQKSNYRFSMNWTHFHQSSKKSGHQRLEWAVHKKAGSPEYAKWKSRARGGRKEVISEANSGFQLGTVHAACNVFCAMGLFSFQIAMNNYLERVEIPSESKEDKLKDIIRCQLKKDDRSS